MPFVTFEVMCGNCGKLFRDRSFSVEASNSFIIQELDRYRRLEDGAHWLCNRCLTVPGPMRPSEAPRAGHGQPGPYSDKSEGVS